MADKWKTMRELSWSEVVHRAQAIADDIAKLTSYRSPLKIYGVPRGGVYAAQAVSAFVGFVNLVEEPDENCIFVDDIIDMGKTRDKFKSEYEYPDLPFPFYALVDKTGSDSGLKNTWVSFPWERMNNENEPTENIRRLIQFIGDDPDREGLKETPERVVRSYKKLFGGYEQKPAEIMKVFKDDNCDEMVIVKDIEFYSTCEHHMLPFFGKAHIAYIPDGKVIGISKLIRILEIYTRRLNIQERICQQVTNVLQNNLQPRGVACVLEAQHFCMTARGVEKQGSIMVTSSLTGSFKESVETRNEFLNMIKGD